MSVAVLAVEGSAGGGGKPEALTVGIVWRETRYGFSTDSRHREVAVLRCDARQKVGRSRRAAWLYLYTRVPTGGNNTKQLKQSSNSQFSAGD